MTGKGAVFKDQFWPIIMGTKPLQSSDYSEASDNQFSFRNDHPVKSLYDSWLTSLQRNEIKYLYRQYMAWRKILRDGVVSCRTEAFTSFHYLLPILPSSSALLLVRNHKTEWESSATGV